MTLQQSNGRDQFLYVIGGRYQVGDQVHFLRDVWEYAFNTGTWRRKSDAPRDWMAGVGIDFPPHHLLVLGGDDGTRFHLVDVLRDSHPGFRKEALLYDCQRDVWRNSRSHSSKPIDDDSGSQDDAVILVSGEIRPRVRTPAVWSITPR